MIAFWKQRSEAGSEQPSAGSTLGTAAEVCMDCQGNTEDGLDASASVTTKHFMEEETFVLSLGRGQV